MKKDIGFTLIELMVTLAIATILFMVAGPSFNSMIKNNRMSSAANEFMSAINLARSESTKRGKNITLASNDVLNWEAGWVVRDGVTIIRNYDALTAGLTLTGSAATIVLDSRGGLSGATSLTFDLCDDRTGEIGERISINVTGRPISEKYNSCS